MQGQRIAPGISGLDSFECSLIAFSFVVHADNPTVAQIEVCGEHSPGYPFHIPHDVAPTIKKRIGRVAAKSIRVAEEVGVTASQWLKGERKTLLF